MADRVFHADEVSPTDIKVRREAGCVTITWRDGHVSNLDAATLRKNCPCATCNELRRERDKPKQLLPILKKDPGVGAPRIAGAQLVGNYAVQFTWSDGHSTGIYDFRLLRTLDAGAAR